MAMPLWGCCCYIGRLVFSMTGPRPVPPVRNFFMASKALSAVAAAACIAVAGGATWWYQHKPQAHAAQRAEGAGGGAGAEGRGPATLVTTAVAVRQDVP